MRARTPGFIAVVIVSVVLGGAVAIAQGHGVDVRDNSFAPDTITITAGETVTWTQSGSNPHSVTANDGSFDSHPTCPGDCMGPGDSFSHTFDTPGEFGYFCKIHGAAGQGMAGTVVVEAAAQDPPPEEEPEEEPDTTDEPQEEPDPADEPADTDEPGEATMQTDETDEDDGAGAATQDRTDAAGEDQQLADTGGRWTLLLLGLVLLLGGTVAVRQGRIRGAGRSG